jgi:hypothetical protein
MHTILAKDLVHNKLTDYMWDSRIAQIQKERRKKRPRTQIQKEGIVYAADVDREISSLKELGAPWEANLPADQKVYLLQEHYHGGKWGLFRLQDIQALKSSIDS